MAEEEYSDAYIKRLQNLGPYKDKSPDEIRELIRIKRAAGPKNAPQSKSDKTYDARYQEKFEALKQEFAVDLNDSNDVEALNNLVRLLIQNENVDKDIRALQEQTSKTKDDIMILKNLGDFQRNLNMSITDVQEKLGITRKARKEKAVDDIPQWIDSVLRKSTEFFNRKTEIVECPKCNIELIRFWLNFPDLVTIAEFSTECPHCGEIIKYVR